MFGCVDLDASSAQSPEVARPLSYDVSVLGASTVLSFSHQILQAPMLSSPPPSWSPGDSVSIFLASIPILELLIMVS